MALSVAQSAVSTATSYNTDVPVTLSSAISAGSAVIVGINAPSNASSVITSVTDSGGNTYVKLAGVTLVADYVHLEVWACLNVAAASSLVVTTHDGGAYNTAQAYAYVVTATGSNTIELDTFGSGTSDYAGTTVVAGVTTTTADELLIGVASKDVAGGTWSTPASFSNFLTAANLSRSMAATRNVTTATTYNTTFTSSNNRGLAALVVALKEVSGGSPGAPTVTTSAVSSITTTTATGNGNVTSDGGSTITERGIVWKTSSGPTTSDNKATAAGTTGSYTASLTSLAPSTHYYVKAYAINANGTSYGSEVEFDTTADFNASTGFMKLLS